MDKNSVIGFILIAVILFGFTFYQNRQSRKYAEFQARQDSIAFVQKQIADSIAAAEVPAQPAVPVEGTYQEPAASGTIYKDSTLNVLHGGEGTVVTIENDKIVLELTSKGAQPYSVKVKNYYNHDSTDLYLFKQGCSEYSFSIYTGEYIQTKDFNFLVAEKTDTSVVFRLPFTGGGCVEQRYVLRPGEYMVDNVLSFKGLENVIPRNVYAVDIDWHVTVPRMEKRYRNETQYSKLDFYQPGDKKPVEIGRGKSASKNVASSVEWFAFQQQFFSAILRSKNGFQSGKFTISFVNQDDPSHDAIQQRSILRLKLQDKQDGRE